MIQFKTACDGKVSAKSQKSVVTYSYNLLSSISYAFGFCNSCSIEYFPDFYSYKNESYFYCYKINTKLDYFFTSNDTAFEVKLLKWFDINLVRNVTSLSGFSDAYNYFMHDEYPEPINSLTV